MVMWTCRCDCGNIVKVASSALVTGHTKSCGCYKKDAVSASTTKSKTTHGQRYTRLYGIWSKMKARCNNKNLSAYRNYGGRGISVCADWQNSYEMFASWAMSNGYKEDLTLDRINVNEGYSPDNCRWADRITQANNTRSNHYIEFNGQTRTLTEWSRLNGIKVQTIRKRLNRGWSIADALTLPPKKSA